MKEPVRSTSTSWTRRRQDPLSDDLLDVYRDVQRGLASWNSRRDASAVGEWRLSFESHWGDQSADTRRALHRSCCRVGR